MSAIYTQHRVERFAAWAERLRREALEACERAGVQVLHDGDVYRLYGPGVDLRVVDLQYVNQHDLLPAWHQPRVPALFERNPK